MLLRKKEVRQLKKRKREAIEEGSQDDMEVDDGAVDKKRQKSATTNGHDVVASPSVKPGSKSKKRKPRVTSERESEGTLPTEVQRKGTTEVGLRGRGPL